MGKKTTKRFHLTKKRIIISVVAILVASGIAAAAYMYVQYSKEGGRSAEDTVVYVDPIDEDSRQVQELYDDGEADEARKYAREQLESGQVSEQKNLELTKALSGLELNEGNYQAAADLVDAYPRDQVDHALASNGGIAYERLGQFEKAAEYYEIAIDRWPESDPLYRSEVDYLRDYIDTKLGSN